MIIAILVLLFLLWLVGYVTVPGLVLPNYTLFYINSRVVDLWNLLTFIILVWLVSILPNPFRVIAGVLLLLWVLAFLGIISVFAGLPSLIVGIIIVGLFFYLISGAA